MSERSSRKNDQEELNNQRIAIENMRFNLCEGQQCIRDFFICLQTNAEYWPDVCLHFNITIQHKSTCIKCGYSNEYETTQMHVEMEVPPNDTNLNDAVEEFFNTNSLVGRFCEDGCQSFAETEISTRMKLISETEFFTVILTRAVATLEGYKLMNSNINAANKVLIR